MLAHKNYVDSVEIAPHHWLHILSQAADHRRVRSAFAFGPSGGVFLCGLSSRSHSRRRPVLITSTFRSLWFSRIAPFGRAGLLTGLMAILSGPCAFAQVALAQVALTPFEQRSISAFNPNATSFKAITLSGSVSWIAGSLNESGTLSLKVSTDGATEENWTLPTQSHSESRSSWGSGRSCVQTDKAGKQHSHMNPDCLRGVPWFAPWMGLTMLPTGAVLAQDMTSSTDTGNGVERLSYQSSVAASLVAKTVSLITAAPQQSSAVSVLYDRTTALPSRLEYDYLVNSDPANAIKYKVVFSDYRPDAGLVVPHRIQRYIQRTLQADITINNVTAE